MKRALPIGMWVCVCAACVHADISDNFESYPIGSFPTPWSDVGFRDLSHGGTSPVPSVTVQSTAGPSGALTQVAQTIDSDQGNGLFFGLSHADVYSMSGDFRIDQYQQGATDPTSSWAVQIGWVDTSSPDLFRTIPQVGPYASAMTGTWRLFGIFQDLTVDGVDMDLGVPATPGVWYHLDLSLVVATGLFHTRILDATTGNVLTDRDDFLPGWRPEFGNYDGQAIFDGEEIGGTGNNRAVFDNIVTVPSPGSLAGVVLASTLLLRRSRRR